MPDHKKIKKRKSVLHDVRGSPSHVWPIILSKRVCLLIGPMMCGGICAYKYIIHKIISIHFFIYLYAYVCTEFTQNSNKKINVPN